MSRRTQKETRRVRLDLACDPGAPGAVREALEQYTELGWILGDVMLVASELVANAVLHSGHVDGDRLDVDLHLGAERVTIVVSDPGRSGGVASAKPAAEFALGGWGLQVVEQLASRWGTRRKGRYEVWAELDRSTAAGPGHGSDVASPTRSAPTGLLA